MMTSGGQSRKSATSKTMRSTKSKARTRRAPDPFERSFNFNEGSSRGRPAGRGRGRGRPGNMNRLKGANNEDFYEPVSYKGLIKAIETHHPLDPDTKKKFNFDIRLTVRDYGAKLSDVCFCYQFYQFYRQIKKFVKKKMD